MKIKLNNLTKELHWKLFSDVTEFRVCMGLPVLTEWSDGITEEDDALHTSLIIEELSELVTAGTLPDAADAIIDAVFVLVGREAQHGNYIPEIEVFVDVLIAVAMRNDIPFVKVWDIVFKSNMSKLCPDMNDYEKSKEYYLELGVAVVGEKQSNGKIAVKCLDDVTYVDAKGVEKSIKKGKLLKSVSYKKADADIANLF